VPRVSDRRIFQALFRQFGDDAQSEWDVAKDARDEYDRHLIYAPRVDFAIGPFNTEMVNDEQKVAEIVRTAEQHTSLLLRLKVSSDSANRPLERNHNPRCFMAIEIERTTSRKHKLGGILNASAIGLVGIVLAPDDKVYRSLVRIRNYLDYIKRVGKTRQAPDNILIIKRRDFLRVMESEP
jgi:hypothetical protein